MRCGCPRCDTFMVNDDGRTMGCICPECGFRCTACLGTDTVISRDSLDKFRELAKWVEIAEEERNHSK